MYMHFAYMVIQCSKNVWDILTRLNRREYEGMAYIITCHNNF